MSARPDGTPRDEAPPVDVAADDDDICGDFARRVNADFARLQSENAALRAELNGVPEPDANTPYGYEKPEHGWTCYHCGRTFHTRGGAALHFGAKPESNEELREQLAAEKRRVDRVWAVLSKVQWGDNATALAVNLGAALADEATT